MQLCCSSCSSKLGNIFLLLAQCCWYARLCVKIISPWRTQSALIRKASWCINFIPPPSVKDYAMYVIKRTQPLKSCTLVSICTHFWQTHTVVLSGSFPLPPPPQSTLLFIKLYAFSCAHCIILLEGRQQEVQPSGTVSVVWSVDTQSRCANKSLQPKID